MIYGGFFSHINGLYKCVFLKIDLRARYKTKPVIINMNDFRALTKTLSDTQNQKINFLHKKKTVMYIHMMHP